MKKPISSSTDVSDLSKLMANAKRLGDENFYNQAFVRRCELEGINYDDPMHREFYQALAAYELTLEEKHGHKQPAGRTRQKLKSKGVEQCLIDWALGSHETSGFTALAERGLLELTAEYVVVKYASRFDPTVVDAARSRLDSYKAR